MTTAMSPAVVAFTGQDFCDRHPSAFALSKWTLGKRTLTFCGHCTGHGESWSREGSERFLQLQSTGWVYHVIKDLGRVAGHPG